ncbi:C48 family peptidase (plasmid) [Bradyrhizobium septentrionale]|uniref:Ulp1 family isopeptidase n=1 Tax=Bradyrhizobium septentrionale TaxID=1404411 RepID=UPI0015968950|nr:Ulp1 family isopeptidase [Bradyrhizobium septentrionale]UGY30315.1 C48 family peptidase [Bradyrhizobium septentrionale]
MDFPSIKWVREQPDSTGPQESSPAAPSADAATFERQLSEIANSGGGGGAMPAASALQPAQSAGVLKGRSKQPLSLYSEDARLISGLEEVLRNGNAANQTAYGYVSSLRSFGRWLFANNKDPIAARLDDQSLTDDAREAIEKGHNRRLRPAIDYLRTVQSTGGDVPITGRADLNPHPQDVALIEEYKNEAATATGRMYASVLRSFSDYLRENNKKGIAARLSGKFLDGDVESYRKDAGGNRNIGAALARLRKSQAGAKAMELERYISPVLDPENAVLMEPMLVGDAAAQHSASQDAGSWLLPVEGYDQDLFWELMDEPGPSSSLEPAARHDQSSDPGETIRPLNWGYDRQQFLDEPMAALARSNLLPSEEVLINDEHDTAELRPAKRPRTLDNLHGLASERQLSEIANSGGGGGAMPAASALQPAQSAGVLIGRSKQPLYSEDARLISGLEKVLIKGNAANQTAYSYVSSLRSFGRWLFANNKDPIAARLDDQSLTDDAREAIEKGHSKRLRPAIDHLRTFQSTGGDVPITGRAELNPHPQDVALIEEYKNEAATGTGRMYAGVLRSFSDYLRENNKKGIAARLSGKFLDGDVESYRKEAGGNRNIDSALAHLRKSSAGAKAMELDRHIPPVPDTEDALQPAQSAGVRIGQRKQPLYSEDAHLISGLGEALIKRGDAERTAQNYMGSVLSFGRWLFAKNKRSIVARLDNESLTDGGEVLEFTGKGNPARLLRALDHLRTLRSTGGAVPTAGRAKRNPHPQNVAVINPEDAALMEPWRVGDAAAQHSAPQGAVSQPLVLPEGYDQDLLWELMDEPGPSSSLEPAARHDQSSDPGESIRPLNWGYDRQQFPDESMGALARSNLLPSEEVLINDEHDTAELRPAKRPRPLDNLHGLAGERQLSEIANSGGRLLTSAPTHQLGASPWQAQPMMQASGHEDATAPHVVATYVGGAAAQHSAPQGAVSRPLVLPEGYDQDLRLMVEDGPPWSGVPPEQAQDIVQAGQQEPARSTSTWSPQMPLNFDWSMWPTLEAASAHSARAPSDIEGGLESFVDLDAPPTPSELRDEAHFAPAPAARARSDTYGGLEAAVHPNPPAPFELRDNAWSPAPDFPPPFAGPVPGHHQGVRQPGSPQGLSPAPAFSDDEALAWLREELARRQMQEPASPSTSRAPSDTYGGLESFVDLDAPPPSELRDDAHFEPAPAARSRSDTYRGFPLVDLTAPTPSESRDDANSVRPFPSTSADAQIGALGPTASSHGRGLVLEDTEWLGDEHIDRDYRLQELDLRRNHPDLAARTRFVNPLIVLNYLRSNDDGVVLTEFQRIVYDNGNDTADFLFLPVINAVPEDPNSLGNHWSLLFVDRRDRGRPVAYHYDSYGGLNNKDAEHLAGRLDLHLEPAGMARQRNGYDCGVFVVDGTRALVRQLEQGREPDLLNLSNLVANRQALQNRLRG